MVSFVPLSTAVADPDPAILAIIDASIGTGVRRTLYVSPDCGSAACPNRRMAPQTNTPMNPRRFGIVIVNPQAPPWGFASSTSSVGGIILWQRGMFKQSAGAYDSTS